MTNGTYFGVAEILHLLNLFNFVNFTNINFCYVQFTNVKNKNTLEPFFDLSLKRGAKTAVKK